jgi:hypothetical protein
MWMAGMPVDSLPVTLPAGNIPARASHSGTKTQAAGDAGPAVTAS